MIAFAEKDAEGVRDAVEGSCFAIVNMLRTGKATLEAVVSDLCANHRAISDLTLAIYAKDLKEKEKRS
jgi:hypothetical protein